MPFNIDDLRNAYTKYRQFIESNPPKWHARYIFPFFAGTYFAYRKVDVLRVVAIAKSISASPSFADIGCGYGDFLDKVRNYIPDAVGYEKDALIFYSFKKPRPMHILPFALEWLGKNEIGKIDCSFIGWMEPGVDFRKQVAEHSRTVITTFDSGGQCGKYGACDYEEFGFIKIASWRTPSWIDVNTEIMNKFYTPSLEKNQAEVLSGLRTAHNMWHIYSKAKFKDKVIDSLKRHSQREDMLSKIERYDFEEILDQCGFNYMQKISGVSKEYRLWEIKFE